MDFIMEILLKNGAYAVMFVGVMAFLVSCITEVLKHITWLDKHVPTAAVVIVLSLVLCPVGFAGLAKYYRSPWTGSWSSHRLLRHLSLPL